MDERLIILNDQGGAVMDITYEITATLRASMGGHAPIICCGFDLYNQSATGGGIEDFDGKHERRSDTNHLHRKT